MDIFHYSAKYSMHNQLRRQKLNIMGEKEEMVKGEIIDHWSHEHPLTVVETRKGCCYVCRMYFTSGEKALGCSKKCAFRGLLHGECADLPRKITHVMHPQHTLIQEPVPYLSRCAACERYIWSIGYTCKSFNCEFHMHIKCAQGRGVMDAVDIDDEHGPLIQLSSHPLHPLRLGRSRSFKCTACGGTPRGRSYVCTSADCNYYWIHQRCATLPPIIRMEHHHHLLSLKFFIPHDYTTLLFQFKCEVCYEDLWPYYWIYHCEVCRYAVHIHCISALDLPYPAGMKNDEKENKIEEEEEEEEEMSTTRHWSHEHPLSLVETRSEDDCCGCTRHITSGEEAYLCSKECELPSLLHEECAEMPKKIRHPLHLQHKLIQKHWQSRTSKCAICSKMDGRGIGYYCTRSECEFQIHMGCALDYDEQGRITKHRSHPENHQLRLLRGCSFRCSACGIKRIGAMSYLCNVCQYMIHQICASLPDTMEREDHHHPLSLSFCVPSEYIKFHFKCDVCRKDLQQKYWIYHCELCRYAVHVKCAFKKSPYATRERIMHEEGIIEFPVNDVAEEQIGPFVMRPGIAIAPAPDDVIHKFYNDKHKLRLVSSSSSSISSHNGKNDGEEEEDDNEQRMELVCNGCTTPIFQKNCMSCSDCKYYLHSSCFHLPPRLPSLPLHDQVDHELLLQSRDKHEFEKVCSVCHLYSNGLFYACTKCDFKADIKCASLPDTIYHAAHPEHALNLLTRKDIKADIKCAADCRISRPPHESDWYTCDSCEFSVHVECTVLPASVRSREWDKQHVLKLTYDANLNHPSDFYCDHCETEMNPKMWMYHCRDCDLSFHPECFRATSGEFRNIKFGDEYVNAGAHPHSHPLTYQLLTTKRSCDVCHLNRHEWRGFHCGLCNFFICFSSECGENMLRNGDICAVINT